MKGLTLAHAAKAGAHLLLRCGVLILSLACAALSQQGTSTSLSGSVSDPSGARLPNAQVILQASNGALERIPTDGSGHFQFLDLSPGSYRLRVEIAGFHPFEQLLTLRSGPSAPLHITLAVSGSQESLTVSGEIDPVRPDSSRTETVIGPESLDRAVARTDALQAAIASTPGWTTENDGLLHIHGVDNGVLYVVNGIPAPDRKDQFFSSAPDMDSVSSLAIITGNIPAEFGERSGAVVVVQPKSTIATPLSATVSAGGGSFDAADFSALLSGGSNRLGFSVGAASQRSDRFLDPLDPRNLHNGGRELSLSINTDWRPTIKDAVFLSLTGGGSRFDVPNDLTQEIAGQDQRQHLENNAESAAWQHAWSPAALSGVSYFRQSYRASLQPSPFDIPLTVDQHRELTRQGGQANLAYSLRHHAIKLGAEGSAIALDERFAFAVTDPLVAGQAEISPAALAFIPAHPFTFAGATTRSNQAAYAQDDFSALPNLTINAGVRYDRSDLLVASDQFSPRIGAVYYFARTRTALRASFNRLFMPPQAENLLLASSPQARQLSPFASASGGGAAILPERSSAAEAGFSQSLKGFASLSATYWWRRFRNIDDPNLLFSTTIIFPNSVAQARAQGVDARLEFQEHKGFSGFLSYTNGRVTEIGPLNGGLFLTNDFIEIGPGTRFTPDHDERNSGAFGVTYNHPRHGLWSSFSGRYESGVPIEVPDSKLLPLTTLPGANLVDFTTQRVKPWAVFGWSGGADLVRHEHLNLSAQVDVQNLFNQAFVYNFGNPFSGTHFGYPRLFAGRLKFGFSK